MTRSLLCAAVLAALLPPAAHATSVADATLSDLHITLLDLAPADGVAPSLTLDPQSRSVALAGAVSPGESTFWMQQGGSAFGPVSSSGAMDGIGGSASFAGDPFGAGATLSVHAVGVPGFQVGTGEAYVDTQPSGETSFTLSAHTQVTFTGLASVAWSASDSQASALGEIGLAFLQAPDGVPVTVAQDEFGDGFGLAPGAALSGSGSRPLTITFTNDSDGWTVVDYSVTVFASAGEVDVPPVPVDEPAGAWLLLAGGLPLAWAARRRTA